MSKLGKSLKNRFLAMALAGAMVMTSVASSGMPVFAEESSDVEVAADVETQRETRDVSEELSTEKYVEVAEDEEVKREDSEENEAEERDNQKTETESETVVKKESTAAVSRAEDDKEILEDEAPETDSANDEESRADDVENKATANTATYNATDGNSKDLVKYNLEGFADSYGVTGGGLLKPAPENDNYYVADSEEAFLKAVLAARDADDHAPVVIEITKDMNLGDIELGEEILNTYSRVIAKDSKNPLMHPTLLATGVTILTLQDTENLTIFSKNGSSIKHCGIVVKRVKNLIIRNITFDELWEWDENTSGAYDRNDWDYIGIQDSDGIWIDHCTFYKAYDGIIDVKYSDGDVQMDSNVTISWCRFLPGSENDTFFDAMMDELKTTKDNTTYYKKLIDTDGLTEEQVRNYAYGQKKTHLLGQSDTYENTKNISLTLANNYYFDSMDRMPRVRWATAHEYNCVLDAQQLYDWRNEKNENNKTIGSKITSNGALSTCEGKVLLENCYIKGINNPLISGNSESPMGSINAVGSVYYMGDTKKDLAPKNNNSEDYVNENYDGVRPDPLITDADEFRNALPYSDYIKYPAESLNTDDDDSIKSLAGAGVLKNLSEVQWEKTSYGERDITTDPDPDEPESTEVPKDDETSDSQDSSEDGSTEENSSVPVSTEDEGTQVSSTVEDEGTHTSSATEDEGTHTSSTIEDESTQASSTPEESKTQETATEEFSDIEETSENDGSDTVIKFGLLMGDLGENLTADYSKNGFTIKVQSGTTLEFDTSGKKIEGISGMEGVNSGGRLKLGNTGNKDNRSIHFTAETAGKLVVYATSASSGSDRPLGLFKKDGTEVPDSEQIALGTGPKALWFEITEPGDYYIASKGGGINLYYIQFSNEEEKSDTEGSGSDEYAPEEVDAEWTTFTTPEGDSVYGENEGADSALTKYNQEGYAQAANVTGGGLLKEDSEYYSKATNELEFIQALDAIRGDTEKPHVIEITTDLDLGNLSLNKNFNLNIKTSSDGDYNSVIRAQTAEPLMHPTLIETGVSYIKLHNFHNLTIFSKNGAMIKHAGIKIEGGTTNVIIRNIVFDELWEWDEVDSGRYKRNDWDYMTIEDNSEGIWIDHCTFYKAYDGIIDLKNNSDYNGYQRVTISWCEILPGSKDNTFFNEQMTWLEEHADETTWYKSLLNTNMKAPNADKKMTAQDIWYATYGHDKTHLLGAGDDATQDKAIRVTIANSYYENARSRLPRLRFGKAHEYNCVLDAEELNEQYKLGNPHITGNGPASTCNGEMLIENCFVNGVRSPLRSGYGSPTGYIKAVDSIYRINGTERLFDVSDIITDAGVTAKVTDEVRFRERLQYKDDYVKYDASQLYDIVVPYAGAGKLKNLTTAQWERTNYNSSTDGDDSNKPSKDIYIVGLESSYYYTGAKIIPDIEVWDYDIPGGKLLAPGTDYTVAYKNNVKPGENTAEVTVTGKGNYSGKDISQKFSIIEAADVTENLADLKGAKIADKIADMPYTGDAQYPAEFTITKKDKSTVKYIRNTDAAVKGLYKREDGKDMDVNVAVSNNVNKGTATILVTGAADAKGKATSLKKTFKITAVDLAANAGKVTVEPIAAVEYAVSGAVPASLTVKYDGEELKNGKDYTVKYANNKKAGEATVTITGKGNYAKKYPTPVKYTIEPLDLSGLTVNAVTAYEGIKAGKVKATVVDHNKTALKASQYTVKLYKAAEGDEVYGAADVLEAGTLVYASAEAKDTVNLKAQTATPRAAFKVGKDISKAKFTVKKGVVKYYTGSEVKLTNEDLTVTMKGEPEELVMGRDYEVAAYINNINKGTATAVIRGIGDYSGTKTVKFKITQKSMTISGVRAWSDLTKQVRIILSSLSNE